MKWRAVALLTVLCNLGCGYHTAGHSVQIPQNVKTIAIPAFKNETLDLSHRADADFVGRARIHHPHTLPYQNDAADDA